MEPLQTPRLILRPLEDDDFAALHALYSDAELMRYITGYARTPEQTRARLHKDLRLHREYGFGLCLALWTESGEVIGRAGLEPRPTDEAGRLDGELAWMFARPWWGRGLATEAGAALIEVGLGPLGLSRVFAQAHPDNTASIRIMEKLGMKRVSEPGSDEVEYEARPDRHA